MQEIDEILVPFVLSTDNYSSAERNFYYSNNGDDDDDDLISFTMQITRKRELAESRRDPATPPQSGRQRRPQVHCQQRREEDQVDLCAYLDEIELNVDYFLADELSGEAEFSSACCNVESMLRFNWPRHACNLRRQMQHRQTMQMQLSTSRRPLSQSCHKTHRFASNFNVDLIPEFVPEAHECEYFFDEVYDMYEYAERAAAAADEDGCFHFNEPGADLGLYFKPFDLI